jgi:SulP family sulfate permease
VPAEPGELRYRLYGALFFGAVDRIDRLLAEVEAAPPARVWCSTPGIAPTSTGVDALRQLHRVVRQRGGTLRLEGLQPQPEAWRAAPA